MTDEEKKAIKGLEWSQQQMRLGNLPDYDQGHYADIRIVLNLIEKQSKEIEELKKELDLDNECEIALNSKVMDLEKEIEELKEDSCCMTNCVRRDKEKLFLEDKIKAKIKELEKGNKNTFIRGEKILVLQSLLEKE